MCIGCALEVYIWLSNKVFCNIHIGDTLNYLNSRCNTAKLLWVGIYVICYGWFSPDLVIMNICRQRLVKVDRSLQQRSLANENAVVCRQGALRWRVTKNITSFAKEVIILLYSYITLPSGNCLTIGRIKSRDKINAADVPKHILQYNFIINLALIIIICYTAKR